MYLYLWLKNWFESEEEGQGLVEYALIIFLVSVALVVALQGLTGGISGVFSNIVGKLK